LTKNEYILTCIIEECAEIQHRICKILSFGLKEKRKKIPNKTLLESEIMDLMYLLDIAGKEGLIDLLSWEDNDKALEAGWLKKFNKINRYEEAKI